MSNSKLVNCTVKSPNHSGVRTHKIDRISPHCVVGQLTAEGIANLFTRHDEKNGASCNYAIGSDGKIALVVDEANRSWCTSSKENDQRAVTIECASDKTTPYAFSGTVYNKLIELCTDICKRNGKSKLLWLGDKDKTLNYTPKTDEMVITVHRWFAAKECPGDWLYARLGNLAAEVTKRLGGVADDVSTSEPLYRVRKAWTDVSSQLFAGTLEGAKRACLPGYSVYDESGKCVYTNVPKGFQASNLKGLSEADRIAKVAPLYVESAKITGMLPSVGIAQFCLESGYGSTDLAEFANNLHGMKCNLSGRTWAGSVWDGESKYGKYSPEVENGVTAQRYSEFRKYPCCEDSIADRAAHFTNAMNGNKKRYPGIAQERDYKKAIHIIKAGNYATDPNYEDKLCDLVDRWDLTQYDQGVDMPNAGDILPETEEPWYRVRKTWADAKSQIEADHDLNLAKACADKHPGYYVFDESGKAIYPVKTTNPVNPILEQCAKFQAQLTADLAAGKPWEYHNPSKYLEEQWANAIKKGKRACNCALLARWALKEAGMIPQTTGIFYGAKGGTIKWGSGAKEAVSKTCDIIKVQTKTVKELISSGELLPGDIVTYVDLQHTNIYAGGGKWYDAGHAYCSGSGEGAKYKSWYGAGTCDGQKVGYVIRQKGSGSTTTSRQYTVQAGSYKSKANADKQAAKIKAAGFDAIVKPGDDGQYKIQCDVFKDRDLAEVLVKKLKAKGFPAIIK